MSNNAFVLKTQINHKTYYLKLQWNPNDVDLFHLQLLCADGKSWSGIFSNDLAQKYYAHKLFQDKDDYYINAKKCMTGEDSEFKLDLSIGDDDNAIFCWKKRFEDIFQVQGSLTLVKDNSVSYNTLIDCLVDENKALRTTVTKMDQQIREMDAGLVKYKNELEKFVDIKSAVEETLYGKFVQLLNTKKQKIQSLEEQLQKFIKRPHELL